MNDLQQAATVVALIGALLLVLVLTKEYWVPIIEPDYAIADMHYRAYLKARGCE